MQISEIKAGWNNMSTGKKVATVAGAVVGTAVVASAVAAGVMGKDSFHKIAEDGSKKLSITNGFKAGYKKLAQTLKLDKAWEDIKKVFTKKPEAPKAGEKAAETIAETIAPQA